MAQSLRISTFVLLASAAAMTAACSDGTTPSTLTAPTSLSADRDGGAGGVASGEATETPRSAREMPASVRWNQKARAYVASLTPPPNQQAGLRAFAYLSLAQYEAVLAAGHHEESDGADDERAAGAYESRISTEAAVAGASAAVLEYAFPLGTAAFEAAVREQAASAGDSPRRRAAFSAGEAVGRLVGAAAVDRARTDRFDAVWTGSVPVGPGFWTGTNPLLPLLGQMRPFYLESGSQFRPPPPPTFGSPAFLAALAEVRHLSDTRTAEQLAIAQRWAGLVSVQWNSNVTDLVTRYHLGETRAAHAYALTNTAAMDANIACHDAKYAYWFIRPFQADPAITTPIGRPNHPSYPSNHACISGTFAYTLGAIFPAERERLAAMADEAGESRLYAGIHYRFDKDAGLRIARQVTEVALRADRDRDRDGW